MKVKYWLKALGAASMLAATASWAADEWPAETHEGLHLVEGSKATAAYVLPGADFSVYKRIALIEPGVAFRKNWQRDTNRDLMEGRVRDSDMERIKTDMAALFLEVFKEELEKGGYAVVDEAASDVMIVRPAIINLDVTAPDLRTAGASKNYVTSAGSASLYVEIYDSVTGQILARALDHQRARDWGYWQWATAATNRAEGRNIVRKWAQMLVTRLDEIHGEK